MSITSKLAEIKANRNTLRTKLKNLGLGDGTENLASVTEKIDAIENKGSPVIEVTEGTSTSIPAGYYSGGTLKGLSNDALDEEKYNTQTKTVTPTKIQQPVTPDEGYFALDEVIVEPIPAKYQDVTQVTATAADVLQGKKIVDSTGAVKDGTIPIRTGGSNVDYEHGTLSNGAPKIDFSIPWGYYDEDVTFYLKGKELEITPSEETQVLPTEDELIDGTYGGTVITKVTVNPIPSEYIVPFGNKPISVNGTHDVREYANVYVNVPIPDGYEDVSDVSATAADVLEGKNFVTSDGVIFGTMPKQTNKIYFVDGINNIDIPIDKGYHDGTTNVEFDDSAIVELLNEI